MPAVKVLIPTPLHSYTGSRSEVEASGSTLDQLTRDLDRQFPGIRFRMIDEQEHIRPHIKIFLNGNQTFELAAKIDPSDEVVIIQAFSGG